MPRFFFHLRDGETVDDQDGMYFPDARSAHREAIRNARDIMAEDVRQGRLCLSFRIEVTGQGGDPVFAVPFRDVIRIED